MSKGGAGDVLTGLISDLIAQGIALIQAVITSTKIHVQAAEELIELGGDGRGYCFRAYSEEIRQLANR